MKQETSLIKLDVFQQALAEAKTIPEVKDLRDQASTFKEWLKKRHASRLDKNAIAELQIRAERKLGVMLEEGLEWGGDRKSESRLDNQTLKLDTLGISKFQSHWWQLVANILEDDFTTYISEMNADEESAEEVSQAQKDIATFWPD